MSGLHIAGEDRKTDADTHLAVARSQNTETGILGNTKDKGQSFCGCLFVAMHWKNWRWYFLLMPGSLSRKNDGHSGGRDGA